MKQLSLVAFYLNKSEQLSRYLQSIIHRLKKSLGDNFVPYELKQIHSTIVGFERIDTHNFFNLNIYNDLGMKKEMNFEKLISRLDKYFPLEIKLGGFLPDADNFLSFGKKPYNRSFSINPSTGKVTLIGWPHTQNEYEDSLLRLRDDLELNCNVRHKYAKYDDNDLFLVLGDLMNILQSDSINVNAGVIESAEWEMRQFLSKNSIVIKMERDDLSFVSYEIPTLDPASSERHSLDQFRLYPGEIKKLYN